MLYLRHKKKKKKVLQENFLVSLVYSIKSYKKLKYYHYYYYQNEKQIEKEKKRQRLETEKATVVSASQTEQEQVDAQQLSINGSQETNDTRLETCNSTTAQHLQHEENEQQTSESLDSGNCFLLMLFFTCFFPICITFQDATC